MLQSLSSLELEKELRLFWSDLGVSNTFYQLQCRKVFNLHLLPNQHLLSGLVRAEVCFVWYEVTNHSFSFGDNKIRHPT
jgi:hypothetical protein